MSDTGTGPRSRPAGTAAPRRDAVIDSAAIAANVRALRARARTPWFMAVVKADGYGHGMVRAARAALAGGADRLGVADTDEALALRAAGVDAPVLAWLLAPDGDFGAPAAAGVELGVSSPEHLVRVAATARGAAVHLKVETGLGRNGVPPERWDETVALAARLEREGAVRVTGIFSHLSNTSAQTDADAERRFADALRRARDAGLAPALVHLSSTAAATARDQSATTMVRCGIGIYGVHPDDGDPAALGLVPAMTLVTEVAAVRRVPTGAGVSYGSTWIADRPVNLALVPVGYADGIPRAASNRGEVLLGGARRAVAGRIAMDQFVVATGDDQVRVGDPVVVFGDPARGAPSASDWGRWSGSIGYEIVTRIGPRVRRVDA